MNTVNLIGRLTKAPELRRTKQGTAVTTFNLAINRDFQGADGQNADFVPCVTWNKLAENVEKYCSKGSRVGIIGALRSRNYDNQHGQKVFVVEFLCNYVQFLDTKKDANSQPASQNYNQSQADNNFSSYNQNSFENDNSGFDITPDDLPF